MSQMPPKASVLIADDHPIVLDGLAALFAATGHPVVARCRSGTEVLEVVQQVEPDILVLDLNMPAPNGLEVARTLKQRRHPASIVLLTSELSDGEILEAMRVGIAGIVLKEGASQQLVACLEKVSSGRQWFDPEVSERAINAVMQARSSRAADLLSARELEVVRLVARGLRNKEVARELTITEGTVKMYLHNIYDKLNLTSRVELANLARDQGLV
jgi:DNA-binding NarL/FixJ family response regulator